MLCWQIAPIAAAWVMIHPRRCLTNWKNEERSEIVSFLWQRQVLDDARFWKLAQALFEVLPHDTQDRKLVSALLGERERFKTEAKKKDVQERL